ncbi:MAG: hypothetical protein MH204_01665 [Fimbriimonadaceae bacterium]|nr:hypothetical protein [Fimbriimonadaceae bacterium]
MLSAALFAATLANQQPVDLTRSFKAGQTFRYRVRSLLVTETQLIGQPFRLPNDTEINYDSTLQVTGLRPGGFATMVYRRPTMQIIEGETAERDRVINNERTNINLEFSYSPINEITAVKDLNPASSTARFARPLRVQSEGLQRAVNAIMSIGFQGEIYRLALFTGNLSSAIDLQPPLPYEEVKVGETWKRTAMYQPQSKTAGSRELIQKRLDWTYTYNGIVESNGRRVHRITGTISLDTDWADFINQQMGASAARTGLDKIPVKFESKVTYDLDLNTRATLRAQAETKGSWLARLVQLTEPLVDETFTGRTTLTLTNP